MSKGMLAVKDTFKGTTYYHLELNKKDWCDYFKECPMENNIGKNYCHMCKHHRDLDIPTLLAERGKSG